MFSLYQISYFRSNVPSDIAAKLKDEMDYLV
jgi:hypothetical protein